MSSGSGIEWTDATWNPVTGCTRVSAGCDHCYAVTMTHRLEKMSAGKKTRDGEEWKSAREVAVHEKYAGLTVLNPRGERHFNGQVRCHEDALAIPLGWKKPRNVFVNSMSDLFHKDVPFAFIDQVFAVMALSPQHTFQVLTKRPDRMAEYLHLPPKNRAFKTWEEAGAAFGVEGWKGPRNRHTGALAMPLPNVWLGTSVENQATADERIPHLLRCPAAVRFISAEPLLGPVDFDAIKVSPAPGFFGSPLQWHHRGECHKREDIKYPKLDWVIVGGESGPGARPCDVAWIRSLVAQCKAAGTACFVKQLGRRFVIRNDRMSEWPRDGDVLIYDADQFGPGTYQGDDLVCELSDPKGGDPAEWPEDLRIRELPR